MISCLARADDAAARIAAAAERALLDEVDGLAPWAGRPPVAALMEREPAGGWLLRALLARPDGSVVLRARRRAASGCSEEAAREMGREAGRELARVIFDNVGD